MMFFANLFCHPIPNADLPVNQLTSKLKHDLFSDHNARHNYFKTVFFSGFLLNQNNIKVPFVAQKKIRI